MKIEAVKQTKEKNKSKLNSVKAKKQKQNSQKAQLIRLEREVILKIINRKPQKLLP